MPEASQDGVLRVDLSALRSFVATVETRLEQAAATRGSGLEAQFFPAGREEEKRFFGRSAHHSSAQVIGRAHHNNAAEHLNRLEQLRDGLSIARQVAQRLLEQYRDLDEKQEITSAAIRAILDDIQASRAERSGE